MQQIINLQQIGCATDSCAKVQQIMHMQCRGCAFVWCPVIADVLWHFSTAWYGTVWFGTVHFWGVFHWVLYLVPGTFLVPPQPRFQAIRTVTKTWRVNSADHRLAGENRHYCVNELATWDPLDLNQHIQRRSGRRTQLLFKQTHLFA